jgi:hypothetical protein
MIRRYPLAGQRKKMDGSFLTPIMVIMKELFPWRPRRTSRRRGNGRA